MGSLEFVATICGTEESEFGLVAGIATENSATYLLFQRNQTAGNDEDDGIYVELNDQINSGYNQIENCTVCREYLKVTFIEPIDPQKKYDQVVASMSMPWEARERFVAVLKRIFVGFEGLLNVAGE
ncbi:MAG: hypothetical protein DWQ31_14855 [Planctomycetota bacterium]|nr:MAG: hypothetical protein DWQ31_14855 [Planctomycetota bacterium]REJ87529.1 MAG: hypothetical protein DWQ35_21320 [Planctomycetota bacterium]